MFKTSVVLLFGLIVLTSCGPIYKTTYDFKPAKTPEGSMCTSNCLDKMALCKSHCKTEERDCIRIRELKAENAYLKYVEERRRLGRELKKDRDYFLATASRCSTRDCDEKCDADQRLCHTACGGEVIERRECTHFCD